MPKEEMYQGVLLIQERADGSTGKLITRIPISGAIIGYRMRIKDPMDKEWSQDFWEVKEIYGDPIPYDEVRYLRNRYRYYKESVDI